MKNFTRERMLKKILRIVMAAPLLLCISCFAESKPVSQGQLNAKKNGCEVTALKKSTEIIALIVNDVSASYTQVGGGGITNIKQIRTDVFMVSISQEERIDQITYVMAMDRNCKPVILKRDPLL